MKPIVAVVQAFLILRGNSTNILTWNAGGGYPLPEFLGGPWEKAQASNGEGTYSDIEKSIAVCLYAIAGCGMPKAFKDRYGPESTFFTGKQEFSKELIHQCKTDMGPLEPADLLLQIDTKAPTGEMPKWAERGENCNLEILLGNLICPAPEKPVTKLESKKCGTFALLKEGCFKKRSTLPVFGPEFVNLIKDYNGDKKNFWDVWMQGIYASVWEEKGCKVTSVKPDDMPRDTQGKLIQPGALIKGNKDIPKEINYEMWSEVALWDILLLRLTELTSKLLGYKDLKGIEFPENEKMEDLVGEKVTSLVKTAVESKKVDAAFFQEAQYILLKGVQVDPKQWQTNKAGEDTAIYVPQSGSWHINRYRSQDAQEKWKTIKSDHLKGEKTTEIETWNVLIKEEYTKLLAKVPPAYSTEKLVTIAVAEDKKNPRGKYLLLSIHSDSDGFFCATFLHLAVELYDKLKEKGIEWKMFIGMDANLQPQHQANKGHDLETFLKSLPSQMSIIDPDHETVFKCRSVLQTQIGKAGKRDTVKKDFMFSYPDETDKYDGQVSNAVDNNNLAYNTLSKNDYYPTIEWPVDHFMVTANLPRTVMENKYKAADLTLNNYYGDDSEGPKGIPPMRNKYASSRSMHAVKRVLRKILRGVFAKS